MIGYQTVIYQNVTILPDIISSLNITLKQSTLSMGEVVVEAESPIIRRDITGSLHQLGRDKIENIPINTLEEDPSVGKTYILSMNCEFPMWDYFGLENGDKRGAIINGFAKIQLFPGTPHIVTELT